MNSLTTGRDSEQRALGMNDCEIKTVIIAPNDSECQHCWCLLVIFFYA